MMEPGDLFSYSARSLSILTKSKTEPIKQTDWTDGSIEFESETLQDVLTRLSTIYGFRLKELEPKLLERSVTVGIPINDEKITLEILSKTLGLAVERSGDFWMTKIDVETEN